MSKLDIEIQESELKRLHDAIKEHPYWISFHFELLKKDVIPMYREVLGIYSELRHNKEYAKSDSPWFSMMSTIYHDFSAMLRYLGYSSREKNEEFAKFYLPTLQNFLQILHCFIEGTDSEDNIIMYMPDNVSHPTKLCKYVPVYHENWIDKTGYKFWYGNYKWVSIRAIKEHEVSKIITDCEERIKTTRINSLKECYKHYIMDLENRTCFLYKIE